MRLNRWRVIPGRGCVGGVVGAKWPGLPAGRVVIKTGVSRTELEKPAVVGDSPVGENTGSALLCFPSSSELVKFAVNLAGPPAKPKYYLVTDSGRVP
jgi:hypothetical protein